MAQIGRPHAAVPYAGTREDSGGAAIVETPPGSGMYAVVPSDEDDED